MGWRALRGFHLETSNGGRAQGQGPTKDLPVQVQRRGKEEAEAANSTGWEHSRRDAVQRIGHRRHTDGEAWDKRPVGMGGWQAGIQGQMSECGLGSTEAAEESGGVLR